MALVESDSCSPRLDEQVRPEKRYEAKTAESLRKLVSKYIRVSLRTRRAV